SRVVGVARARRLRAELDEAARAYDADRFNDALRVTRKLVQLAPGIPEIRELHGLVLYRLGRWREAIEHLEAFREMTGTAEEDHVLADAYRALRRWDDVEELWDELRRVSPNAEVVNEGRIVVAGSYADRGDLGRAIRLLEKGWRVPKRPQIHHLRRAYALADLYERSGQTVRARELFRWVMNADREFADVVERVQALG
ncbi:MAG TPA: tetratricopeptide repeat protein, partial [Acidimicrobiales bacterium]